MAIRRMRLQGLCPACHNTGLDYVVADLDLPYFGNVNQLYFSCDSCGFRHSDILIGTVRDPTRWTLRATKPEHLNARVVRSTSGTIRIPELGVLIEPGPASDAYVSNVEGVLVRVEGILRQLRRDAVDEEAERKCDERLAELVAARDAKFPFTFILEDPNGNSVVIDEAAERSTIDPKDAESLKRGEFAVDLTSEAAGQLSAADETDGNGHRPG